jgi:hypothetical protein
MRKKLVMGLTVMLVLVSLLVVSGVTTAWDVRPLVAGKKHDAGYVDVSNNDDFIYVEIYTTGDWTLVESSVAIGLAENDLTDIPQNKNGKLVAGHFPSQNDYSSGATYGIHALPNDYAQNQEIYIVIHVVVTDGINEETGWGGTCFVRDWTGRRASNALFMGYIVL